jgi:hypothetical protein
LRKTEVADSIPYFETERYHAKYLVTYNFSCFPGGYDSNIVLHANEENVSRQVLFYSGEVPQADYSQSFAIEGPGPLTLRDMNPDDSNFAVFDPGCNLSITFTKAPSTIQTGAWLNQVPGVVSDVNLNISMAEVISDIKVWYAAHVANPAGTAGFLRSQILGLRQPGASAANIARADAFQAIIDGNPLDATLAPLAAARAALDQAHERGRKLQRQLKFAAQENQAILDEALDRAKAVLERTK